MKFLILALVICFSAAPLSNASAGTEKSAKQTFKLIRTGELATWMQKKESLAIFDANTDETRSKDGVIPGAVALASTSSYDTSTLPSDKATKLVFYCANTACMASHAAAKRATEAGYKSVFVMSDGIEGWKKAGKPTEPFHKS